MRKFIRLARRQRSDVRIVSVGGRYRFTAAGKDSIAALRTTDGGTEVRHYSTATGAYGAVLTSDSGSGSDYQVIGVADARFLPVIAMWEIKGVVGGRHD